MFLLDTVDLQINTILKIRKHLPLFISQLGTNIFEILNNNNHLEVVDEDSTIWTTGLQVFLSC